jgi:hypothetical protein
MPTETRPAVTIISPVYNAERFIERCIDSVLAQTFTNWEQIIVDDGSTDGTEAIVRRYHDPRIRYVRLPHRGLTALAETYNTALQQARGDLIAVLEGDDAWPADKLAKQVPVFSDAQIMLSWGWGIVVDDDDRYIRRWAIPRLARRRMPMAELFRILVRWNVVSPALTVMTRRAALQEVGGFTQTGSDLFVDLPTWLTLTGRIDGMAQFINDDLGLYRIHTTNTGTLHNSKMRFEHQHVAEAVIRQLGAERMRQLGWSREDDRVTLASLSATRGIGHLQLGEMKEARKEFATSLRNTRSIREAGKAAIGYTSTLAGVNLIRWAQRFRYFLGSVALRIRNYA